MDAPPKITLIGAGPVGLEMAVTLKHAGIPYTHLEAGPIGATMAWWPPGTRWFSSNDRIAIAGVPLVTAAQEKATREEYLAYLRGIVQQFALEIQTFRKVTAIRRAENGFEISLRHALFENAATQTLTAEKIILATGGTATPNLLGIPGENLPHVSHYFADPHAYFGKRVLIIGGCNSAVEAALRCHKAGAKVLFSYHGPAVDAKDIKYWLYPEFSSLLKSGTIESLFNSRVQSIQPDFVTLLSGNQPRQLAVDFVLAMTGYKADMSLARMAGVALSVDQEVPKFDPRTMETNVPGVYVIGTAVAGTQRRYKIFLENCHSHAPRVGAHLRGLGDFEETFAIPQVPET